MKAWKKATTTINVA